MLTFASLCPHSPLLVPTIAKKNPDKLKNTIKAFEELEKNFSASQPETVIIITPHGLVYEDAFSINLCDQYQGDFEEFGEFSSHLEFKADPLLANVIKIKSQDKKFSLTLDTCQKLDHGVSVPLSLLTTHYKNIKLLPLSYALLDLKTHFEFGQLLKEAIQENTKQVAVVASGDLSHRLTSESPAGFAKEGALFDEAVREAIKNKNLATLFNLDQTIIDQAQECGLKPLVTLLGILHGLNYDPEILSYESPLGIGYLTCNFKLN